MSEAIMKRITKGGKCGCGTKLPDVKITETPFQFCSLECKIISLKKESDVFLVKRIELLYNKIASSLSQEEINTLDDLLEVERELSLREGQ